MKLSARSTTLAQNTPRNLCLVAPLRTRARGSFWQRNGVAAFGRLHGAQLHVQRFAAAVRTVHAAHAARAPPRRTPWPASSEHAAQGEACSAGHPGRGLKTPGEPSFGRALQLRGQSELVAA